MKGGNFTRRGSVRFLIYVSTPTVRTCLTHPLTTPPINPEASQSSTYPHPSSTHTGNNGPPYGASSKTAAFADYPDEDDTDGIHDIYSTFRPFPSSTISLIHRILGIWSRSVLSSGMLGRGRCSGGFQRGTWLWIWWEFLKRGRVGLVFGGESWR